MFLTRRITELCNALRSGKINIVSSPSMEPLIQELRKVQFNEQGEPILETCGPLVRSMARMSKGMLEIAQTDDGNSKTRDRPKKPLKELEKDLLTAQKEYFWTAEELLNRLGIPIKLDVSIDIYLKANAHQIAPRLEKSMPWFYETMNAYYAKNLAVSYEYAKETRHVRSLLSGQRFLGTHLGMVKKSALITDTTYIPDPIMPWIEVERDEEKFPIINLIKAVHWISQVAPLGTMDLSPSPVVVFPSFEKWAERESRDVQDGISLLFLQTVSYHLGEKFEDEKEVFDFAKRDPQKFTELVRRSQLYLAPNGAPGEPMADAIARHREEQRMFRKGPLLEMSNNATDEEFVVLSIMERMHPQFHLRENASSFLAQPLLATPQDGHIFGLVASATNGALEKGEILSPENAAIIRSLGQESLGGLGNIPVEVLAEIRKTGQNEALRRELGESLGEFSEANFSNINAAAGACAAAIKRMTVNHASVISEIKSRYQRQYGVQAVESWASLGLMFVPWVGPFLSPVLAGDAFRRYLESKHSERQETNTALQSMAGILSKYFPA